MGVCCSWRACPGDLEEAERQATEADNALPEETLEQCVAGCEEVALKEEEDCKAQLSEEEKIDKTSFDSPFLRCRTDAEGTRNGCQVELTWQTAAGVSNAAIRGGERSSRMPA